MELKHSVPYAGYHKSKRDICHVDNQMRDKTVVMHQGEAVRCRTQAALLADKDGKYRELWDARAQ